MNMVAELGRGPRRLVFSGHLDTVPVGDTASWSRDPWGADGLVDGRLYGRGSVDMKGQVAAMALACAAASEAALDELTLTLAITGDEEVGHMGVKGLASEHVFQNAVGAIICEPTGFSVVRAHKGGMTVRITVHGVSCHSSKPHLGINAIDQAVRLLSRLETHLQTWRAQRHPAFGEEPPTFSVVRISGGVADNVVPNACEVHLSARALEFGHFENFRAATEDAVCSLVAEDAESGLTVERRFAADMEMVKWAPPMVCDTDLPWYQVVASFARQDTPQYVTYGTDAGVLHQVGLPCVVWGPGDIIRAHSIDEYVTVDELRTAVDRYSAFIDRVAAAKLPTVTTSLWTG
jgi:acetylornithine deacetylase/succinyl-diaminopimelate desuccinylase-like protein